MRAVTKEDSHLRVATTDQLIRINDNAISQDYNRALDPKYLSEQADPDGIHVIEPILIHEHKNGEPTDPHWRCRVMIKQRNLPASRPGLGFVDVSFTDLDQLESLPLPGSAHAGQ